MNRLRRRSITFALALLMVMPFLVTPSYAQIAGGGGGGLMNQIITWVVTNIATGVIAAGVLLVGGLLIAGRHSLEAVIVMVIGGLVIANWQTIAGMFGV
jgi:type IV secretory pathway VirB2 component (pilin)